VTVISDTIIENDTHLLKMQACIDVDATRQQHITFNNRVIQSGPLALDASFQVV